MCFCKLNRPGSSSAADVNGRAYSARYGSEIQTAGERELPDTVLKLWRASESTLHARWKVRENWLSCFRGGRTKSVDLFVIIWQSVFPVFKCMIAPTVLELVVRHGRVDRGREPSRNTISALHTMVSTHPPSLMLMWYSRLEIIPIRTIAVRISLLAISHFTNTSTPCALSRGR